MEILKPLLTQSMDIKHNYLFYNIHQLPRQICISLLNVFQQCSVLNFEDIANIYKL